MSIDSSKRIVRLLGVGLDATDGHIRMTTSDDFDVVMGSEDNHEYMAHLLLKIEEEMKNRGVGLHELQPADLYEMIQRIV